MIAFIFIVALFFTIIRAASKKVSYNEHDEATYRLPWIMPFNSKNASYIFIQIGVHMLNINREDSALKRDYIHHYVKKHFFISSLTFRDYYVESLKLQHSTYDLEEYLKKKLKTTEKRVQVVHYLCGLAFADGIMMSNEQRFITNFCKGIGLTSEEISAIVNVYFAKQQEKDRRQKQSSSQSKTSYYSQESLKRKHSKVLDISENADLKKIKSAYRKLAKKWHPDIMINHSDAEKRYAHEKFLEIQEAYDFLSQS